MQAYVSLGTNRLDGRLQTVTMKKRDETLHKERERECCSSIHLAASGHGPTHCPQWAGPAGEDRGYLEPKLGIEMNSFSETDPDTLIHI